ncbi:MAG: glycosyltransferase family 2 protein [Cyanobacteria bacterium P01_B01_bin.77]
MALISVIVLTKNEEPNLAICLDSLKILDADVYIVDSGSTDGTLDIAKQYGCKIFENPWKNYATQLNWALSALPINTPWTMRLDADERLTPELVTELQQLLPNSPDSIGGYQVKRRVFFMGRWIRHGGYYPTWLLRIWRSGIGTCEQLWMDEHIVLSEGKVVNLQNDIIDENQKGLTFWTDKHNRYADREVLDILADHAPTDGNLLDVQQFSQAKQRRWVKTSLYNRFPLFLRAFIYWLLRYTIGLGFLDGLEGLIFHFLQGFWYRFLVDAKIYELLRKKQLRVSQQDNAETINQSSTAISS